MTNRQNPQFLAISVPFSTLKTGNSNANVTIRVKEKGRRSVSKRAICPNLSLETGLPGIVVALVDLSGIKLVPYVFLRLEGLSGFLQALLLRIGLRPLRFRR